MFANKVFQLYDYQREIAKSQSKNGMFSKILNKELPYETRMMLDDMFYQISTSRVVDPSTLKASLKLQKGDPTLSNLKMNIDVIIDLAEQVIHEPTL